MDKISGNVVTAEDAVKYSRCGGYHGHRTGRGDVKLNAEETCYGMYMYFLDNVFNLRTRDAKELKSQALNGEINKVVGSLEGYIMSTCLDKVNKKVVFSEKKFVDFFSRESGAQQKLRRRIANNAALIPYIVQYVLLQNGIAFEDRNIILRQYGDHDVIDGMKVTRNNKHVLMADTRSGIDKKIEDYRELGD